MAKARSPVYPAIGLKEAIDRVKLVYAKDYTNKVPRDIIAQHMGYSGLSGKSLGVLSALSKYGLLEGRGSETRVSQLAVTIIAHEPGSPERVQALREAASMPSLFVEMDERSQGGRGSDAALRAWLLTEGFIPAAADAAIRSYRETKQLVEAESVGYHTVDDPLEAPSMERDRNQDWSKAAQELGKAPLGMRHELDDPDSPPAGMRRAVFTLAEGDVELTFPETMLPDSIDDLEGYMKIWLGRMRRDAAKKADASE